MYQPVYYNTQNNGKTQIFMTSCVIHCFFLIKMDKSLSKVVDLISLDRLNSYQQVFDTKNENELIGVYFWNIHISSLFFKLSTIIEVSLRNSIHNSFSNKMGNTWWQNSKLHYSSYSATPDHKVPEVVSNIRGYFKSARSTVIRDKKDRYSLDSYIPKDSEVISATVFYVWELLLDKEFVGDNLIWPSNLSKVFKGWPKDKNASELLQILRDDLKSIRDFRNRIAHNEPIWKAYGVTNDSLAIEYLVKKLSIMENILNVISPEKRKFIEAKGLIKEIKASLTKPAITSFKSL